MERLPVSELLLHIFCILIVVFVCRTNAHLTNCLDSDREALMDFKTGLADPYNVLSSWRGRNCCHQWHGIQCDNNTGAVVAFDLHNPYPYPDLKPLSSRYGFLNLSGEMRPSLMKLKSLRRLDLSFNTFNGIPIPQFFGSLENLEYLNLSHAGFSGLIPPHLGNLSCLEILDLKTYDLDEYNDLRPSELYVDNFQWITGLISLEHLAIDGVNLSLAKDWIGALNQLPSIVELHLSSCNLFGYIPSLASLNFTSLAVINISYNNFHSKIPDWLVNISSLQYIDMIENNLYGRIPLDLGEMPNLLWLNLDGNSNLTASCSQLFRKRWGKIKFLNLRENKLHGKLPSSLGNMTSLISLYLDCNAIDEGGIPSSIGKLCNLNYFSLSGNKMTGSLPEILQGIDQSCSFRNPLPNTRHFDLSNNQLSGKIPYWLGQLENFVNLDLSHNLFEGLIPASLGSLENLTILQLAKNKFSGTLPEGFGQLSSLSWLDVSSNQFTGTISEFHFSKLSKLTFLDLSSNSFIVNVGSNWMPPFQVKELVMSSCIIGPSFPAWLQSQNELTFLDLSNASISDSIPNWFWKGIPHLTFLSLSHNHFSGQIPESTGEICNSIEIIDLSSNNFTKRIPSSLANCSMLKALDLSSNKLSGAIPNSVGQLQRLQVLHLSNNQLSGNMPSSLINLSFLETMDLGNNELSGKIPAWIGDGFSHLTILSLRSNAFCGEIPSQLSKLSSLQVLDLGENGLSGSIPASFGDLKAMAQEKRMNINTMYGMFRGQYYQDRLVVNTKGQSLMYTKTLSLVTSIDLSGNNLSGRFPKEITKLPGLVVLNLSRNHITGNIPENISNMHQLMSLDLSINQLIGSIPQSLSSLSFLGYLNLSHNNLSGVIPYTGHMTTFEASSFAGNPGLYGCPLPVRCIRNNDDPSYGSDEGESSNDATDDGDDDGFINEWFYSSLGVGFASGLLVPFFILSMKRSWSAAYFDFADVIVVRFLVLMQRRTNRSWHLM